MIAIWSALIALGLVFVPRFISSLGMTGLWVPGSESSQAAALLSRDLPAAGGNPAVLVFTSHTFTAADPQFEQVVASAARKVSSFPGVRGVELPSGAAARALVARSGHTALAVVALGSDEGRAEALTPQLLSAAAAASTSSVQVTVTGEPPVAHHLFEYLEQDLIKSDAVGLPVALAVLLVVFGSLVAAGLPLLLALGSLGITMGAFGALSLLQGGGFNLMVESSTVVLALGIGIDYALFVVTRFRKELSKGSAAAEAAAVATATAGHTVLVSGSTLVVALAPVLLVNDPAMRQAVAGPMVAVAVLVAAALSLLPAVLAGLGTNVDRISLPQLRRRRRGQESQDDDGGITAAVLRQPVGVLLAVAVVLASLSVFTFQLRTGLDYGLSTFEHSSSIGRADAAVSAAFGPGAIAPIEVVLSTRGRPMSLSDLQALANLDARLRHDSRVAQVVSLPGLVGGPTAAVQVLAAARADPRLAAQISSIVNAARGADVTLMTVVPHASFDSAQAMGLVTALRGEIPAQLRGTDMRALVGGASAAITDFTHEINAKTPLVLALILLLALTVLALGFRSLLVALVGLAGTLLSVGAAYGLLVFVFQMGAGQTILDFRSPGFVQVWLPLFLVAVLVGLSTDYQVFLISQVKEEWDRSHDARQAISSGLQRSGPVILSAAAIMLVVFASFLLARVFEVKELGFALAVAVLIDAALTRRLLVPAALVLLGNRAWGRVAHQSAGR